MTWCCRGLFVLSIGTLLPFLPVTATAVPFSSSVERFEADGNEYGSVGGALDLVDEFDDATIAPNWAILLGTATEVGDALTFHDPGVLAPLVGLPQEISVVEGTTDVADGAGNFTLTSYWDPTPLPLNRQFFFQIYALSPVVEAWGFTVNNFDSATAAVAGTPVGYSIGVERVFPLGNQLPPVTSYVSIVPASITGRVVLRMSFDDSTNLMTYSFSLDGGTTFQSPFAPIQAFMLSSEAEVLLGAAAIPSSVPPPPACTLPMYGARVRFQKIFSPPGEQAFHMKGTVGVPTGALSVFDPITQGALLFASGTNGEFAVYQIPPGAVGGGGCGPGDGWKHRGSAYTYLNESGALPPGCVAFSSNGIQKVKLRDERARRARIPFVITAKGMAFMSGASTAAAEVGIGGYDPGGNPVACSSHPLTCQSNNSGEACR